MNRLKIPLNLTYDDVLPYLGLRRRPYRHKSKN